MIEWDVEEVDQDGDVIDHHYFDTYNECRMYTQHIPQAGNKYEVALVLTYSDGDRAWAYVQDNHLAGYFCDAYGRNVRRVAKKYIHEVEKSHEKESTKVLNLLTDKELTLYYPPEIAVKLAYLYHSSFPPEEYETLLPKLPVSIGSITISCGDWVAYRSKDMAKRTVRELFNTAPTGMRFSASELLDRCIDERDYR